ncbi:MAG: Gfo/Idh/MocA family oxidoreductase [Chloroflexota bacterium]
MSIGWAIVSTGRHPDTKMAPAIAAARDAHVAAAVSRDAGRARAFTDKHGGTPYTDLTAALADPAVDAVYIASPNFLHRQHTEAAAAAGKHVLVEKPIATTVADAEAMVAASAQAGVHLGVGFHLRTHPGHVRLRALVAEGALGTVSLAEANWGRGTVGQVKPPPRAALQAWWDDPAKVGAGAFMATGVHCADLLRFVLDDEVSEVSALIDATEAAPLEELVALTLRFRSGALATVMTGRRTPGYPHNDLAVYGSGGAARMAGSIEMSRQGTLSVQTQAVQEQMDYGPPDGLEPYTLQVEAFCAAMRGEGRPAATGEDGLAAARITEAMVRSARTGQRVRLD